MNQEIILPTKPTLADVRTKFEIWRKSRKKEKAQKNKGQTIIKVTPSPLSFFSLCLCGYFLYCQENAKYFD